MDIKFARDLIKGKIAETVFELMFREDGRFTVIPIGYEHTMPELIQCKHHPHVKRVLDNLRDAPDFALINEDKSQVYLVECKYRSHLNMSEIKETCTKINERYAPCFIFVATTQEFYYENCRSVLSLEMPTPLSNDLIPTLLQKKYLALLNEFESR